MSSEESVEIDVWTAAEGQQQAMTDKLGDLLERMSLRDGFVGGEIHRGADGATVLSYTRVRTRADRENIEKDKELLEDWQDLQAVATPHRQAYDLVRVFYPPKEPKKNEFSRGSM